MFALGTAAQKYGPGVVSKFLGEAAGSLASRAAAIASSPAGIAASLGLSITTILEHCKCNSEK